MPFAFTTTMSGFWQIHDRLQLAEAAFGPIVDGPSSTPSRHSPVVHPIGRSGGRPEDGRC
jgi:hypothetical protein